ncbi:MAG: FkbM family methyltransferase [Ferruginibacter sp.]
MNLLKRIYSRLFKQKKGKEKGFETYVFDMNTRYDLQTFHIIREILKPGSNTIDIGAHKGDILIKMIEAAPDGKHFAFEPIPDLYGCLKKTFKNKAAIFPYALGDKNASVPFNYVTSNPAYSGLLRRKYDRTEKDTTIEVEVRKLDDIIPADIPVEFIKIDVEGAEFGVLKGAVKILTRWKPVIIYEQGIGGSDIYGTEPDVFYDFMHSLGYSISLMEYYLLKKEPLGREEYCNQFRKGYNFYFIAYKALNI